MERAVSEAGGDAAGGGVEGGAEKRVGAGSGPQAELSVGEAERVSLLAGKPAPQALLVDVPRLVTAFYTERPDPDVLRERVSFGTSGHRGSSLDRSFNEAHILAVTEAIRCYRASRGIDGPLFLGRDTHALSFPAYVTALEVLAANGVEIRIAPDGGYTPTPAISHAILTHNRRRSSGLADGIVVTPSHNPPEDGGFKYNPPHGGPAETEVTRWIGKRANQLLEGGLRSVKRIPHARALRASTTQHYDFMARYVAGLSSVLDLNAVAESGIRLGVDPLGGAGIQYWKAIADRYRLDISVVSEEVDPTFRFMTVDHDGKIRMDPSSPYAMRRLLDLRDRFDLALACDPDHDRHGIVTPGVGLLPPNDYLAVAADYLFMHRPDWQAKARVGRTAVTSALLDRVAARAGRSVYEVPVGFKWFVEGLLSGDLGFAGEESAGASFLREDGSVWTTDKDGIVAALLAAEISARTGRDPGEAYRQLTTELGASLYRRVDRPASPVEKARVKELTPERVRIDSIAGEPITGMTTRATGNGAPIGGLKVTAEHGWFAVRPSGTEAVVKLYVESFRDEEHLDRLLEDALTVLGDVLASAD